jgi:NAD(P)-dependent dehydrogenase (short-subunit alcohol dehydrogenase family)
VELSGRVAIVTGAGAGLGRSHALHLAEAGAAVVVNDLPADDTAGGDGPAERVVAEIRAAGGQAAASTGSIADVDVAAKVVEETLAAFGRVDIVVNNAGITRDAAFHKMTDEQVRSVLDVHLLGTLNLNRACWPHFRGQEFGRVVNTTSAVGLLGNFGQANYAAAKAGIVGLTRVLAIEGAKYGICVNAVAPVAETSMTDGLLGKLTGKVPAEAVSPLVRWLANPECTTTGQVYSVGGGRIARFYVGMTPGWATDPEQISAAEIALHWDEINAAEGGVEARTIQDDFRAILAAGRPAAKPAAGKSAAGEEGRAS